MGGNWHVCVLQRLTMSQAFAWRDATKPCRWCCMAKPTRALTLCAWQKAMASRSCLNRKHASSSSICDAGRRWPPRVTGAGACRHVMLCKPTPTPGARARVPSRPAWARRASPHLGLSQEVADAAAVDVLAHKRHVLACQHDLYGTLDVVVPVAQPHHHACLMARRGGGWMGGVFGNGISMQGHKHTRKQ